MPVEDLNCNLFYIVSLYLSHFLFTNICEEEIKIEITIFCCYIWAMHKGPRMGAESPHLYKYSINAYTLIYYSY